MGAASSLGVPQFWMFADGAHDSFPCADIVSLCHGRCCEDRLLLTQTLAISDWLLGKTQERARVVKAQLNTTLIWLLDYVLSTFFKTNLTTLPSVLRAGKVL